MLTLACPAASRTSANVQPPASAWLINDWRPWLHAYRYSYLIDVSLACWRAGETAFDQSGRARRLMAAKLRRDVAANVEKIDSVNFDRPLLELLDQIDFEAIADHWLARFSGYRR